MGNNDKLQFGEIFAIILGCLAAVFLVIFFSMRLLNKKNNTDLCEDYNKLPFAQPALAEENHVTQSSSYLENEENNDGSMSLDENLYDNYVPSIRDSQSTIVSDGRHVSVDETSWWSAMA